jgi:chromosome segregation ATPase
MNSYRRVEIVDARPSSSGLIHSTRENRDISAREKIEETIVNIATALGCKTVTRAVIRDGTSMYSVDGGIFQRGANTILDLSRSIVGMQRDAI